MSLVKFFFAVVLGVTAFYGSLYMVAVVGKMIWGL
jgi:hypothetical protein